MIADKSNPPEITQLIEGGRNTSLAWMPEDTPVEAIAEALTALANNQGGNLLIGLQESGTISGVQDGAAAIDRVLEAALSIEPPLIIPLPEGVNIGEKLIVSAKVPNGLPYVYGLSGRYLQRRETDNVPLSPPELRRMFIERGEISFETNPAINATLDDIDWNKVSAYVGKLDGIQSSDQQEVLIRRGCLTRINDVLRPTNAGILLFGKDPQRYIRGAEITAARFAGKTMSDTFTRQDITGTLPDQIKRAETFLVDHLRKGVKIRHTMARQETYEYPMEAARELVVNAVAHRDYSISGDTIRLFLFQDRMEVSSPGGLAGPITLANIKDERFSRNPVIVQVLADMGFIERLGYGVDRVIELMHQHGLNAPDFYETTGGFRVTLRSNPQAATDETSKDDDTPEAITLNPRQEAALNYLSENSRITNSELQRQFPDVHAETIRRDLADLVTKDLLSKMGQKRGSYYVLKGQENEDN